MPVPTLGPMDTLQAMRVFTRVVETGSFSRAAAEMKITQPTATKAVADAEQRLGARLLHRSSRGVAPTEVGELYYQRCKVIAREVEEAEAVAALAQGALGGSLRISTSVAFGRRVMVPLMIRYMREHPGLQVDLSFEDRYVNLVEQGVDLAIRMGPLADSSLGATYLASNPWLVVASPAYLARRGTPSHPEDLQAHDCLVYSSVQGDDRWPFSQADAGATLSVPVRGPLRSNNLSAVLAATRAGLGISILPWYVAQESLASGDVVRILPLHALPAQEIHAVYPSPRLVPRKVSHLTAWLRQQLGGDWWLQGR